MGITCYWALLLSALLFGVSRVGFYESPANTRTYNSRVIDWMRSRFFRFMDIVVVPGHAAAETVRAMGVQPSRIMQGFNAVDVSEFHRASSLAALQNCSVNSNFGHRYLYVGQLIHRKRVDAIIAAFTQIATPYDELTILGSGSLRGELESMASLSNARISFLEYAENSTVPAIMSSYHTLVLASEREVWGLVVNEALASGMHVVVTENCGVLPSVRGMRGIYAVDENLIDLAKQMTASRRSWNGRILQPEILRHTPERFAGVFDSAFILSLREKKFGRAQTGERDEL
ncbi:uncharacterized glycosyltransferase MJ1607 [Arthrobacter sp. Hiyo6]|nr:uncharacterized glycosyltransferase MJ1607 [Arthrobacter sp. Hiyo6]